DAVEDAQSAVEDFQGAENVKRSCPICFKKLKSNKAFRSHRSECHDGEVGRKRALSGAIRHISLARDCPRIYFRVRQTVDSHFLYLAQVASSCWMNVGARGCSSWKVVVESDQEHSLEFERQLVESTRHVATARVFKDFFQPAELQLEGGDRVYALILNGGAKRLKTGAQAFVRTLEVESPAEVEDVELKQTLQPHCHGSMVRVGDYKPLEDDDPVCHEPFLGNGKVLARKIEGCCPIDSQGRDVWSFLE
ncbi:hypothetical protein BGZ65_011444, partial [Modicella reniformis]